MKSTMWGPDKLLNLHLDESFDITGRGKVVVCSLKDNGYTDSNYIEDRAQLRELFMDKIITFENAWWIIKGIESHAAMNRGHERVGFLIQKWGLWHQLEKHIGPDATMVMTGKYHDDDDHYYGADGQYFQLPLSAKHKTHDVLVNPNKDLIPVIVTNEPIEYFNEVDEFGNKYEYWLHTVALYGMTRPIHFWKRKHMLPGTILKTLR